MFLSNTMNIILIVIMVAAIIAIFVILYIMGKKNQKKRDEQQATIDSSSQEYTILVIDKKKMRLKDSGLPEYVINETPKIARMSKVPIVKAKIGPKIMLLIADNDVYDMIPVKKEIKATMAGIYISSVRGIRGQLEKPEKKKNFMQKLMGEK